MSTLVHFKTNTLLKNLVGKDLINDDKIAIIELVKNSFDAASNSVLIRFDGFSGDGEIPVNSKSSQLLILDYGEGMDISDLKDKWLNIAYSEKKTANKKPGDFFAGNKGIGRFSCDRLGKTLDLLTRKKGGSIYHLRVDWPSFEVEGKKDRTIQDVDLFIDKISEEKAKKISGYKIPSSGTLLCIRELRSAWTREKLLELKRMLEKFLNPNQLFQRTKFKIELSAPELSKEDEGKDYPEQVNVEVRNQIFDKLKFNSTYIDSSIDKEGKVIRTELYHEGEPVFRLKEKNIFFPHLKNVHTVIYYLNPYKKAYFKRQTGVRLLDFGSIFLFLNGFRVAPYGDRSDDWLGLDVRKTQGTTRYLSSRDLIGRIEVLDSEEVFVPISSREGLKNTAAFIQLRGEYFLDVHKKLEKFVVDGLDWDSIPAHLRTELRNEEGLDWSKTAEQYSESWDRKKQRIALSIMSLIGTNQDRLIKFWFNPSLLEGIYEQRGQEIKNLIEEIGGFGDKQVDSELKGNLTRIGKLLAKKESQLQEAKIQATNLKVTVASKERELAKLKKEGKTYRAQTLFLQSISSLDEKKLITFHHQICLDSSILDNYLGKAIKFARTYPENSELMKALEKISIANKRILATAQFATKANFSSATKKESTDIPAFFEQYLLNVAKDFVASGIKLSVENTVSEAFEIKARRIELSILADNIISNAMKANAKNMKVVIKKFNKNNLLVSFIDDGDGLSASVKDVKDIFEIGVTSTSGSGLGLFHVKQIVDSLGGTIEPLPGKQKGFELRVVLTR